ncbi:MAG: hypothetical protein H0X24_13950 [Ktedonobacterales bacterium]|nr:hypothetical protein [Ktedonobacterales bacterium]
MEHPTLTETDQVVCINEGVYSGSLTYGKIYQFTFFDNNKRQYKIKDDKNKSRWYPTYCFDAASVLVPHIVDIQFDEPEYMSSNAIDVTITFNDGHQRWCTFITPDIMKNLDGEFIVEGSQLFFYGNPHLIIVSELSDRFIKESVSYITKHGKIIESTLLLK